MAKMTFLLNLDRSLRQEWMSAVRMLIKRVTFSWIAAIMCIMCVILRPTIWYVDKMPSLGCLSVLLSRYVSFTRPFIVYFATCQPCVGYKISNYFCSSLIACVPPLCRGLGFLNKIISSYWVSLRLISHCFVQLWKYTSWISVLVFGVVKAFVGCQMVFLYSFCVHVANLIYLSWSMNKNCTQPKYQLEYLSLFSESLKSLWVIKWFSRTPFVFMLQISFTYLNE